MDNNTLFYGDNLEVLKRHIADSSVDLVYLDPPFNSRRAYNVLFRESSGASSAAQIEAFEDSWRWEGAAETYHQFMSEGPPHVTQMLDSLVIGLGKNDVSAYLVMMSVRLVELQRVLRDGGSIFLHCDPTAGAYLRVMMDAVFGTVNFVNEIVWKRFSSHGNVTSSLGKIHDTILFYRKPGTATWNQQFQPLSDKYVKGFFTHVEPETGRRYRLQNVLNPNPDRPNLTYEWNGHVRTWKWTKERMQRNEDAGILEYSKIGLLKGFRQYLDDSKGSKLQDVWDDIPPVGQSDDKSLGYATQKPLALLERIIQSASNEGDVILDPFCGCGTALFAAEKLNRRWLGIDMTHLAINVIRRRLRDGFSSAEFETIGEPVDIDGATALAERDKYQFQFWALDRLDAQPVAGKKRGSDKGIDGVIPFYGDGDEGYKRAIVSVKGGTNLGPVMIRDLVGVIDRENAPVGVFVCLADPTRAMRDEAAAAGYYENDFWQSSHPRVQIITVAELLNGAKPDLPPNTGAYAEAKRVKTSGEQLPLT